jgi:hypothetical protein
MVISFTILSMVGNVPGFFLVLKGVAAESVEALQYQ